MIKILILGSTGLLGNTILRYFSRKLNFKCYALIRKNTDKIKFKNIHNVKFYKINYDKLNDIKAILNKVKPHVIVNCIGLVKQLINNYKISEIIKVNSLMPHYLSELTRGKNKIRFIHFSTDCVFLGNKGNYTEQDLPDANDIYGKSKILGELNYPNTVTIRTSIIGHELQTNYSLLNWFLDQKKFVKGYKNAIFSGLTTLEIAKILDKYIIPNKKLTGIIHLSGKSISKYDLLKIVSYVYKKEIKIIEDKKVKINRSLNSNYFKKKSGYKSSNWTKLIQELYEFKRNEYS